MVMTPEEDMKNPEDLLNRLVDRLLQQRYVRSTQVEQAFRSVRRHFFVPSVATDVAYAEEAIVTHRGPDGLARSSSEMPAIMAAMVEQLDVHPGHRVLEVGAGTGYNAAILAWLAKPEGQVTTIDIDEVIVREAREHLVRAGFPQVRVVEGDGWLGAAEEGLFDRIEVTVGVWDLSPHWVEQLMPGGIVVIPLWLRAGVQTSIAFKKSDGHLQSVSVEPCGFMRLRGPHAGPEGYVQAHHWIAALDESDPSKIQVLRRLLNETPSREPAPELPKGWSLSLALREPRAIILNDKDNWRKWAAGIFDADAQSLALIFDHSLEVFGNDNAKALLLDRVAGSRPLDLRKLYIEAMPSKATSGPASTWAIVRPNFRFFVREREGETT